MSGCQDKRGFLATLRKRNDERDIITLEKKNVLGKITTL